MKVAILLLMGLALFGQDAERARQVLEEGAKSKEGDMRRETAVAMSLLPARDKAADLIDALLEDKDYQVRMAATETLGEWNDRSRVKLLLARLNDDVPEVAFAAAKGLYLLKEPEGLEALQAVYEGDMKAKSGLLKKSMMDSWRRMKTPKSALLFSLRFGLVFVPVPGLGAGYGAMMGMLGDADFSSRAVSLMMVCTNKDKACEEMLGASFQDEDWTVRASGIQLVSMMNQRAKKPLVAALVEDKKDKVRLRAAATLLRLEARPAGPARKKTGKK